MILQVYRNLLQLTVYQYTAKYGGQNQLFLLKKANEEIVASVNARGISETGC